LNGESRAQRRATHRSHRPKGILGFLGNFHV
jgi:hypothetical protein